MPGSGAVVVVDVLVLDVVDEVSVVLNVVLVVDVSLVEVDSVVLVSRVEVDVVVLVSVVLVVVPAA